MLLQKQIILVASILHVPYIKGIENRTETFPLQIPLIFNHLQTNEIKQRTGSRLSRKEAYSLELSYKAYQNSKT